MLTDRERDIELSRGEMKLFKAVSDGRIYRRVDGGYQNIGTVAPEHTEAVIKDLRAYDPTRFPQNPANRRFYSLKQGKIIVEEFNRKNA